MNSNLFFNVLLFSIPILAIVIAIRAIRQGAYMDLSLVDDWGSSHFRDVKRGDYVLLSASFLTTLLKGITALLRLGLLLLPLLMLIAFLPHLPAVERAVNAIFGAALERLHTLGDWFADFSPILVFWLVMGVAAYYLIKLARLFFDEVNHGTITLPGFDPKWSGTTYQLTKVSVMVITFVAVYSLTPGSNTPTIQMMLLLTSLLAGLGAKDIVTDIVSGLVLTYSGTFDVGDKVRIGDIKGKVRSTSLLRTVVHTVDKKEVSIPNKDVVGAEVENYNKVQSALIELEVKVGYDIPWRIVHELLLKAAHDTPGVITTKPGYEPGVLQESFEDFAVVYLVYAYIDRPRSLAYEVKTPLRQNIQDQFRQAGIPLGVRLVSPGQLMSGYSEAAGTDRGPTELLPASDGGFADR
ncbi:MAG: hypothetical protein Kow0031_40430 [Anaerolineae bacterium]